jgi:hypothetical protein
MSEVSANGRCPECGYIFDRATTVDDDSAQPKIGDISFCIKCGAVNQFDEHGVVTVDESTLDDATRAEIQRIRRAWMKTRGSEYAG